MQLINPSTSGLYRVVGTAQVGVGPARPWRVVLKVVKLPDLTGTPLETGYTTQPEDWNYWKREVLARRSGLPDLFTSPLRAVRCWGTEDMDDTTSWLWLEELDAASGRAAWSLAELANAAYDLGAFAAQGVATLEDVQRLPWAAHRWLRGWLDTAGVMGGAHALSHDGCWTHPLIRDRLPASAYAVFAGLMAAADRLLRSTRRVAPDGCSPRLPVEQPVSRDGGPRTSHGRHRLELLRHCTDRAGSRPPHRCQCFLGAVQPSRAEEHAQTATAAYLEGLRAFGWRGASEDVQFAAVAAGALQNLSFAVSHIAWLCPDLGDPDRWPDDLAERQSTDVDAVMDAWCESFRFLMSLGERAMRLVTKD